MRSSQPAPSPIRVLVADNSVINTELLAQAIGKDRRIRVVDVSTNCSAVLNGVLHANPSILLISESLDQCPTGGLEVLRKLRNTRPDLKAIVLLDSSKRENVLQAFQAGARGLFCRSQPVKMLCKCISVVSDGQVWANTEELGFLLEALAAAPSLPAGNSERLRTLSERERDVVACLAEGLSNRDIAMRLTISQHTVKNYMFRIFEKLGVSSRLELLFLVLSRTDHGQDVANQHPSTLQSAPKSASYSEKKVLAITSSSAGERKAVEAPSAPRQLVTELGSA